MQRYCHAKESLQKAVDKQLSEFGKLTAYVRKDMILKLLTTDCNIVGIDVGESSGMYNGGLEADKNSKEKSSQMKNFVQHVPSKIVIENLKKTNLDSAQINGLMSGMSSSHTSVFAAKYLQNYDIDDGTVDSIATSSQRFFHAPTVCRPHTFDYRQIFLYQKHDNKWQMAFLEALSKDLSTLTALQKAESQIAFAASECASTIWKNHLHSYILEGRDLHISKGPSVIPFLRHQEVETNNTEDRAIIDKILADACNYLRKNPKFVMAQLPEAHKLPMLREWISRRFGKVYSPKERRHSYRYSLQIFHALDRMPFNFSTPTAEQLSKNQFVPYDCKTYLSRKVRHYHHTLKK